LEFPTVEASKNPTPRRGRKLVLNCIITFLY